MIDLRMDVEEARMGRQIWLEIKKKHSFDYRDDCLVILPSPKSDLNQIALEKLSEYIKRKYLKKAVIVSCYRTILESDKYILDHSWMEFEWIDEGQCRELLKYYRLTQFTKNVVVISLEEPFGNKNIIGKEGITLSDYIVHAIYV